MPSVLFILGASIITAAAIVAGLYALSVISEQTTDAYYDDKYNIIHPEHTTKPSNDDDPVPGWENNAGDPIIFLHPYYPLTYGRQYPDQMHWNTVCWFTFAESREFCSRNMIGTLTLFHDTDNDRRLTDGEEMFWSLTQDAYTVALKHDTNGDYHITKSDSTWDRMYVTDFMNTWQLGYFYQDISLVPDETFPNDCFGPGIYANPETYVKDWAYYDCLDSGNLDQIKYILEDDIRIKAYIKNGATMANGTSHMSLSAVQGYWEKAR